MHNLYRFLFAFLLLTCLSSFSPTLKHSTFDTSKVNGSSDLTIDLEIPPTFTNCPPSDISATYTSGECGAVVTWTPPTASPDAVSVTSNYSPGDSFLPGTTAVIYRAQNAGGQVSTCSFNVTVTDDEDPVFDTFPTDITLTADPNTCTAPHSWIEPTASDNCPAGSGYAPVLQDFESTINQCYTFSRSTIGNGGEINGTRNLVANSLSSISSLTSSITTPVFYFNGYGEITFSHKISSLLNSPAIHLDILDSSGNVVTSNFFTESYTTTGVQQEIIPISLTGNYQLKIRFSSSMAFGAGLTAYLDNLLIPGTIVTNINDTSCSLADYIIFRSDGTGLNSGNQFDVGTTTIKYTVRDAAGNFTEQSFNIHVENDVNPPSGTNEYYYCEGQNPPTMTVNVDTANGETANWYDSLGNLVASNTITYTAPASPDVYRNYLVYAQNSNGCSSEDSLSIDLYQIPSPQPPTAASPIEYCVGDTATPLTATALSGHTLRWYTVATGGTGSNTAPTPNTSTTGTRSYYVSQIDNSTSCESNRAKIDVIINPLPPAPTLFQNDVNYCIGESAQQLNSYVQTGSNLTWYDAATGGNSVPETTVPNTSTAGTTSYWVSQTNSSTNCKSPRRRLRIIVHTAPVITSQPMNQTLCEGNNANFTTTTSNAASLQWQTFDGSSWNNLSEVAPYNNTQTNTLTISNVSNSLNGSQYRLIASSSASNCTQAVSNTATMMVNTAPAAPISGGNQIECEASPIQTLSATATAPAGSNIVWFDAPIGGNTVSNPNLNTVGSITYYAESVDNTTFCTSFTRTEVSLTIEAIPAAPTSGGNQTACEEDPTQTMTATATPPTGAIVEWYDAPSGGSMVASPILDSPGTVTYYAQSNSTGNGCSSTSRTPVSLTMHARPTINLTPSSESCSPDLATYSVSVDVNRGTVSSSEGLVTDNGGNNWTISGVTSGNNITVTVTDVNTCSESITINAPICGCPTVDAPTSGGDQTECETSPIQTLTATATPPAGANIIWYDSATNGNSVASPIFNTVGTITYFAESVDNVNGCISATRTPVTLTIQEAPAPPTSGGNQTECESSPIQTLTASATCAVGTNMVWYDAANGGNPVASPTLNTIGTITYYAESRDDSTNCASPSRTAVTLTIESSPAPPTSGGDQMECETSPIQTLTATATPPAGANIIWYDSPTNGNSVASPTYNSVGTITYFAESVDIVNGCTSATRTPVTLTIQAAPAPPTSGGNQTECETSPLQTLTATATSAVGTNIIWYDAANGGNTVASPTLNTLGTITYYAESRDNGSNCASHSRTAVTLSIEPSPAPPTSGGDQTECEQIPIQTLTAQATTPIGSNIVWYDAATAGNTVASPTLNAVGTITYYAESIDDTTSCVSLNRTPVTLTIDPLPNVVANASATSINAGEPVTLTGSGANSYVWDNGVIDGDTVFPLITTTYTVLGTDGNTCESTDSVTITVLPTSDIRLEKAVDITTPNVGDIVTFTLTVFNDGPSDDTGGTIVTDVLPAGYTYMSNTGYAFIGTYDNISGDWTLPALNNGDSVSIDISATVNAPTAVPNEYTNVAQISSATNYDSDSAPNNNDGDQSEDDEASVSTTPQVADLELNNTISQSNGNPGDTVLLTIVVQNNGPSNATNVSIENMVPDGFTITSVNNGGTQSGNIIYWSALTIPSGTSVTLTYEATINYPTYASNEYLNTVQVSAVDQFDLDSTPNNDDGDQSEDDEASTSFVLQEADLEIINTITPDSGNPGDSLTLTVEIRNNGSDDATGIAIENIVPPGLTILNINNNGIQSGNIIRWNGITVPTGTSQFLTFDVIINAPTNTANEYVNTVQVVAVDQLDPDSAPNNDDGDQSEDDEDSAEIVLIPADLSLDKKLSASSNQSPNAGETVIFELTVINAGPGIATNVSVEDTLPVGYAVGMVNNGGSLSGNVISWNIENVPVGTQTLSYEVTLNAPTNAVDEYTNIAQITNSDQFDPDSQPNNDDGDQSEDDEVRHLVNPPTVDLEISKTVDKQESFIADTLVFTITVTNNSDYEATNVGIEDILPAGYILVSTSSDLGNYNQSTFTWEIPSIPIGTVATLEMTVTVIDVEDYTNIAELIYVDQIDLNLDNDRDEVTPAITQSTCLTVYNEFSPNNDGANDVFFIECIENYPNNILKVFNRWGVMVFSMVNYDNSWDGTSTHGVTMDRSKTLPVGTYFYILETGDLSTPAKTGWLYISR